MNATPFKLWVVAIIGAVAVAWLVIELVESIQLAPGCPTGITWASSRSSGASSRRNSRPTASRW
jgi:hypothetical protein